ncbi:hypothetical protein HZS_3133 [Henneguya salminicola]|nr:hypothetical protein HZS_3133 [Henneguya salminicola]
MKFTKESFTMLFYKIICLKRSKLANHFLISQNLKTKLHYSPLLLYHPQMIHWVFMYLRLSHSLFRLIKFWMKLSTLFFTQKNILEKAYSRSGFPNNYFIFSFSAGCLTAFETYNTVCGTIFRQKDSIHELEEIQSKIFLPQSEFVFHSIIVCPIQQNEIQGTESAIRLECGHVISLNNANEMRSANTPEYYAQFAIKELAQQII